MIQNYVQAGSEQKQAAHVGMHVDVELPWTEGQVEQS